MVRAGSFAFPEVLPRERRLQFGFDLVGDLLRGRNRVRLDPDQRSPRENQEGNPAREISFYIRRLVPAAAELLGAGSERTVRLRGHRRADEASPAVAAILLKLRTRWPVAVLFAIAGSEELNGLSCNQQKLPGLRLSSLSER